MKISTVCLLFILALIAPAHAQEANDDSSQTAYLDGWQESDNGGVGFPAGWVFVGTDGSRDIESSSANGGDGVIDAAGSSFHVFAADDSLVDGQVFVIARRDAAQAQASSYSFELEMGQLLTDPAIVSGTNGVIVVADGSGALFVSLTMTNEIVLVQTGSSSELVTLTPGTAARVTVSDLSPSTVTCLVEPLPSGTPVTVTGTPLGTISDESTVRLLFSAVAITMGNVPSAEANLYVNSLAVFETPLFADDFESGTTSEWSNTIRFSNGK